MHRLAPVLVAEMGEAYPELRRAEPVIVETLRQEEERFRRTLGRGMALLDEATAGMNAGDMLSGETAFKLYDTYGFPLDLTQDAVRNKGISVDLSGFEDAMKRQREQAREAWTGSAQSAQGAEWFAIRERLGYAPVRVDFRHQQALAVAGPASIIAPPPPPESKGKKR